MPLGKRPFFASITAPIQLGVQGIYFSLRLTQITAPGGILVADKELAEARDEHAKVGTNARILTQPLLPSYHVFSEMHENRMNIGHFYDLAFSNSFNPFA